MTGLIEDVLVQVDDFIFSANFYIMDMEGGNSHADAVTIILSIPFLKMAHSKIDVHVVTLTMEFSNRLAKFNILDDAK